MTTTRAEPSSRPAVEDRSPLDAELAGRVNIGLRVIFRQGSKWLLKVTGIERVRHK